MPGILLLIPRWFQILKTIFILLWVAEGLVEPAPGCILEDEASNYFNSWSYFELAYPRHPGPGLKSFDLDPLYYKLRLDWRTIDHFAMDHEFVQHYGFDGLISEKVRHASVICSSISEGCLMHSRGLRTILLWKEQPHCHSLTPNSIMYQDICSSGQGICLYLIYLMLASKCSLLMFGS